ncbi:MAG: nitroreductase family protein [Lachnospiraceae bacterium]|nr:nitroreductase family protein [Lachnospiraceae bacterium]
MMIETILKRRSIRKYTDKKIDDETLHKLLECGMSGPTCANKRDWAFLIADDKETLEKIAQCNGGPARMLPQAAMGIVVCGDLSRSFPPAKDYWIVDASIATQNIILAATEMGIGSVWLGTWPEMNRVENIIKLFQLPGNVIPLSVIALGYPTEERSDEKKLYEEDRVHFGKW